MRLYTVCGSHRVHLFKNQKQYLRLYHQSFRKNQKLEKKTRKKNHVSAVHSEESMRCLCFSASCRLLTLSRLVLWATSGEAVSRRLVSGPSTRRSCQLIYNRSLLHNRLWGRGPSGDPVNQQKQGRTSSSVPSLKIWGFALFQSHVRLMSFN